MTEELLEEIKKLDHNTKVIVQEILYDFSHYIYKKGFTDSDLVCEEPLVTEEYINKINL